MHEIVLKRIPSLFLRTLSRTVTRFLFFSLGKKKVGGNTIIHTIRINLPSHFGYAILIIIDILQQKLKDFSLPYDTEKWLYNESCG